MPNLGGRSHHQSSKRSFAKIKDIDRKANI